MLLPCRRLFVVIAIAIVVVLSVSVVIFCLTSLSQVFILCGMLVSVMLLFSSAFLYPFSFRKPGVWVTRVHIFVNASLCLFLKCFRLIFRVFQHLSQLYLMLNITLQGFGILTLLQLGTHRMLFFWESLCFVFGTLIFPNQCHPFSACF